MNPRRDFCRATLSQHLSNNVEVSSVRKGVGDYERPMISPSSRSWWSNCVCARARGQGGMRCEGQEQNVRNRGESKVRAWSASRRRAAHGVDVSDGNRLEARARTYGVDESSSSRHLDGANRKGEAYARLRARSASVEAALHLEPTQTHRMVLPSAWGRARAKGGSWPCRWASG